MRGVGAAHRGCVDSGNGMAAPSESVRQAIVRVRTPHSPCAARDERKSAAASARLTPAAAADVTAAITPPSDRLQRMASAPAGSQRKAAGCAVALAADPCDAPARFRRPTTHPPAAHRSAGPPRPRCPASARPPASRAAASVRPTSSRQSKVSPLPPGQHRALRRLGVDQHLVGHQRIIEQRRQVASSATPIAFITGRP